MQGILKSSLLVLLIGLTACSGGGASVVGREAGAAGSIGATQAEAVRIPEASSGNGTSIDAGGGGVGSWSADEDYSGGWVASVGSTIDTKLVANPAPQAVYQSQRTGPTFSYAVPKLTPNGSYTVRLHFVESWFSSAGKRLFNVGLNGEQVLSNFDTYRAAGGQNIAVVREFTAKADATGEIVVQFSGTTNNASVAGVEVIAEAAGSTPTPVPTASASTLSCSPRASNPTFSGCFRGKSPYHITVPSLLAAGAKVHDDSTASNFWHNGNPLNYSDVRADGTDASIMWEATSADPQYSITCPAYGTCDAATSITGLLLHIPPGAAPESGTDHHIYIFDAAVGQEVDMWGGLAPNECQVGTQIAGVLTCSWGGLFPFSGNGLPTVPGDSAIAGGVAYGLAAITAGDILSGHIKHALGLISPCLDNNGQYPAQSGRSSDSTCGGSAAGGGNGAEPTLRYGDMLHLKSSVNLNASPYANYSPYCKVVVRALQEYGAYADDTSAGYGLHLIPLDQRNPGWQTIMASMIAGGDAVGTPTFAGWPSCLNRIRVGDLEAITLNQGGNGALP